MKKYSILVLLFIITIISCSKTNNYGEPNVKFEIIQKDFMEWWTYNSNSIMLSSPFIALDSSSNLISKELFLKTLTSGDYIPLKLNSTDKKTYYKLYKLDKTADINIASTIKNVSLVEYEHYKMEGIKFPKFNYKDLNGKIYNSENTIGKIVVLKFWYIHCQKCVEEMPELNKLVKQYENRNDIVFVSLASDSAKDLEKFLTKKNFSYPIVPNQDSYMRDTLNFNMFPTHLIINKKGLISKVVNTEIELRYALKNEK